MSTKPGRVQFELFERFTGHGIDDLASPLKTQALVNRRVEPTLLGVSRYGFHSSDLADVIKKHPSSTTRWLIEGLSREHEDRAFWDRIRHLDRQISAAGQRND